MIGDTSLVCIETYGTKLSNGWTNEANRCQLASGTISAYIETYVTKLSNCWNNLFFIYFYYVTFIQLRTSSHLQLRPGQDKAKQFDTNNNTELHME